MKVETTDTVSALVTETLRASQTSGSFQTVSYQCRVKLPSGMVGKRSELNEKTKLAAIGAKTKQKMTQT